MIIRMLIGVVGGLLCAWILQIFGFGNMITSSINQLTGTNVNITVYYTIFAIIGLLLSFIGAKKR